MSCLGVLFSLDDDLVFKLRNKESDEDRLDYLQMEIEEVFFEKYPDRLAELDKSWDALHRSLTDGKLEWTNGDFPLNHVVLGGELLYYKNDYIMTLKTPDQVEKISAAIERVDKESLRQRYFKMDPKVYGFDLTEDDFEYTWDWFNQSKDFWKKAALEKRFVLFTADQ